MTPPASAARYQEHEDVRVRLLEEAGYDLLRDGLRWRYPAGSAPPNEARQEHGLEFRTLSDVGEDTVRRGDRCDLPEGIREHLDHPAHRGEWGARGRLGGLPRDEQEMDYLPEWWELAYTADGNLAGVIMAARNPTAAVISYVGIVPELRGRARLYSFGAARDGCARVAQEGGRFAATATARTSG